MPPNLPLLSLLSPQNVIFGDFPLIPGALGLGSWLSGGVWSWQAARSHYYIFCFLTLPPLFTVSPQQDSRLFTLGTCKDTGREEDTSLPQSQRQHWKWDRCPHCQRGNELHPSSAAFPGCLWEVLGSPSQDVGLVCTRCVFWGKAHFPPVFLSPWRLRERGISQGHRAIASPTPQARAALGCEGWLQPGCGCKYLFQILPEPISPMAALPSLAVDHARISESPCRPLQQHPDVSFHFTIRSVQPRPSHGMFGHLLKEVTLGTPPVGSSIIWATPSAPPSLPSPPRPITSPQRESRE